MVTIPSQPPHPPIYHNCYFKSQLMQALFEQLKREGKTRLLDKCMAALQQLERELQQQIQINQEQKHLISILQDTKDYYEQEYQQCKNLAVEVTRANALAAAHRKASQELHDSMVILQERAQQLQLRVQVLERQLGQKESVIEEKERVIRQERGEKEVLEAEWNKVVRAVKRKMANLVQEEKSQANKQNKVAVSRGKGKEVEVRMGLMERAHKMLAHLQREEAIDQFQGIFLSSQGSKHSIALQENRQVSAFFNSATK